MSKLQIQLSDTDFLDNLDLCHDINDISNHKFIDIFEKNINVDIIKLQKDLNASCPYLEMLCTKDFNGTYQNIYTVNTFQQYLHLSILCIIKFSKKDLLNLNWLEPKFKFTKLMKKQFNAICRLIVNIYNELYEIPQELKKIIKPWLIQYDNPKMDAIVTFNDIEILHPFIHCLIKEFGGKINLNWIDVSQMTVLCKQCPSLVKEPNYKGIFSNTSFNGNISRWDVSNVENMNDLFQNCDFNGDLSHWNVSNVKSMVNIFNGSKFNRDISKWDVSNVRNFKGAFSFSKFNGDLSKWNVGNAEDMANMFMNSKFTGDISHWNVSHVKTMFRMFSQSKFNGDLNTWNVSKVKSMANMFAYSKFNQDISKWDVSSVDDMSSMFEHSKFNGNISTWNINRVISMEFMFSHSKFNQDISKWDVSYVFTMMGMFEDSKFNQDISHWDLKSKIITGIFKNSKIRNDFLPIGAQKEEFKHTSNSQIFF